MIRYVPPGVGIRVGLTEEPNLVNATPLPEESPQEQDCLFLAASPGPSTWWVLHRYL